jgi:hypothetical protein
MQTRKKLLLIYQKIIPNFLSVNEEDEDFEMRILLLQQDKHQVLLK